MILPNKKEHILAALFGGQERTAENEKWAWRTILGIARDLRNHRKPQRTGTRGRPKGKLKLPVDIARRLFSVWRNYAREPVKFWRWGDKCHNGFGRFLGPVLEGMGNKGEFIIHPETLLRIMRAERRLMRSASEEQGFIGWSPLDPKWRSAREKFARVIRE